MVLAAISSSRSDFVTQSVRSSVHLFVRCSYPYFYIEALEANFDVLMFKVLFHQCLTRVLPVLQKYFTSTYKVYKMCFKKSFSKVFQSCLFALKSSHLPEHKDGLFSSCTRFSFNFLLCNQADKSKRQNEHELR